VVKKKKPPTEKKGINASATKEREGREAVALSIPEPGKDEA